MVGLAERGRRRSSAPRRSRPRSASCGSSPSTSRATTAAPASPSGPSGSSSPTSRSPGCPSCARSATTARRYLGPFGIAGAAEAAIAAAARGGAAAPVHPAAVRRAARRAACVLAEMGRCGAPCDGRQTRRGLRRHVVGRARRDARRRRARGRRARCSARMERCSAEPSATRTPARTATGWLPSCGRPRGSQRLAPLDRVRRAGRRAPHRDRRLGDRRGPARPARRHGGRPPRAPTRGRASTRCAPPREVVARRAAARRRRPSAEETEKVLRWLERPGVRLVSLDGEWTCPVHGAGAERDRLEPLAAARRDVVGFDEPGGPGLRSGRRRPSCPPRDDRRAAPLGHRAGPRLRRRPRQLERHRPRHPGQAGRLHPARRRWHRLRRGRGPVRRRARPRELALPGWVGPDPRRLQPAADDLLPAGRVQPGLPPRTRHLAAGRDAVGGPVHRRAPLGPAPGRRPGRVGRAGQPRAARAQARA